MRWSPVTSILITTVIASLASPAEARKPRARTPVVAPAPPAPPQPPAIAFAPLAPVPPLATLAPDAPQPPSPPRGAKSFSFSFGRGRLGVGVSSMSDDLRRFFGASGDAGILVQSVETDTTASKAGVKVGDVIVRVDGDPIADVGDVAQALADRKSGDTVDIEVVRDKKTRRLKGELRDDPAKDHGSWHGGGDLRIEGLPPGAMHFFGGADEEALRQQLEALTERLERLERKLGGTKPKPGTPKRAPKKSPRPAADHT